MLASAGSKHPGTNDAGRFVPAPVRQGVGLVGLVGAVQSQGNGTTPPTTTHGSRGRSAGLLAARLVEPVVETVMIMASKLRWPPCR